jgi:hypothetical protein
VQPYGVRPDRPPVCNKASTRLETDHGSLGIPPPPCDIAERARTGPNLIFKWYLVIRRLSGPR